MEQTFKFRFGIPQKKDVEPKEQEEQKVDEKQPKKKTKEKK